MSKLTDKDKAPPPPAQSEQPIDALLPVSDDAVAYLRRLGMSLPEIIRGAFRVFRPGGPLDDGEYVAECCSCGFEKAQTLRWFGDHDFTCECGGKFDAAPLHAFNVAVANGDKSAADLILRTFFRPIKHVKE
jgi:hypothetical protein